MTPERTATGRGQPSDAHTGTSAHSDPLAELLGQVARSLEQQPDLQATMDVVVRAAVDTIPGTTSASISVIQHRQHVKTLAATDELPRAVDHAQYDIGEGPCLDSLYTHRTVRLSDLGTDRRWPRFADRARELGVGSMLAVQLYVDSENLGVLNLMSRQLDAFHDESENVALLFASHAAVAMSGERTRGQLQAAMGTRELIGQAQGILMERFKVTAERVFHMLMLASQHSIASCATSLTSWCRPGSCRKPEAAGPPRVTGPNLCVRQGQDLVQSVTVLDRFG